MTDTTIGADGAGTAPDAAGTGGADGDATTSTSDPKPTETVDYWKQRARENERRARENADAAKRLAEIEDAQKTEAQKTAERLQQLEQEAAQSKAEALRLRTAAKFGISDEDADLFLTGTDEATLTRQAERLAGRTTEQTSKTRGRASNEGRDPGAPKVDEARAFVRGLFATNGA